MTDGVFLHTIQDSEDQRDDKKENNRVRLRLPASKVNACQKRASKSMQKSEKEQAKSMQKSWKERARASTKRDKASQTHDKQ